ncbi:cysteine hydrolase [Dehalococcoidia bacterium]|nr:cysteine hydrolase [Dehalococcoidia bacterium]
MIFANDSFLPEDFIFQGGRIKPHAIMGTEGAGVIAEFEPHESDIILEKRRFSAFLGTNLDTTLRDLGVDCIAVAGISTPVCVLTTVLDGISHEFKVIILVDRRNADVGLPEDVHPLIARSCLKHPDKVVKYLLVVGFVPRMGNEILAAHGAAEVGEEPRLQ